MRANIHLLSRAVAVGALSLSGLAVGLSVPTSAGGAAWDNASHVSLSATVVRPLSGGHVLGWGFDRPTGITSGGNDIWVTDSSGVHMTQSSRHATSSRSTSNRSGTLTYCMWIELSVGSDQSLPDCGTYKFHTKIPPTIAPSLIPLCVSYFVSQGEKPGPTLSKECR